MIWYPFSQQLSPATLANMLLSTFETLPDGFDTIDIIAINELCMALTMGAEMDR